MKRLMLVVLLLSQWACAGPATGPVVAGPIRYEHEARENPPMHLHVAVVDLTAPGVSVVVRPGGEDPDGAGPWVTTLATVRAVANREDLALAVNGDFFASKDKKEIMGRQVAYFDKNWAQTVGVMACDGKRWSDGINNGWAALCVLKDNRIIIASRPGEVPRDAREVVGGSGVIVKDGKAQPSGKDLAPRTAAGVDKEGKTLILLVVDGRRKEYSAGMTTEELGKEMIRLGAWSAINLDGGGSSTMVMKDPQSGNVELKNRPSDGHDFAFPLSVERPVANVLGVKVEERK